MKAMSAWHPARGDWFWQPSTRSPRGLRSAARYSRTNSSFYIDAIYDGHFNLSLVGKSLTAGYEKLGGAGAFGSRLPPSRLAALAAAYSIPAVRLEPHPAGAAKES